ncbi:MAG: toll/interleukin-1 receptor domain-containing protein [Acidobacteria bacterium]|nr:toll/interleukin-1 receptor domain-containing protein [Acidobacteriota bacterium]
MADIFLSYSTRDTERVRPLVAALERQGWSVWWDRKVPPGMTWRQMIEQALQSTKCVLVVWSVESIQSRWVVEEAEEGHSMGIMLPCMIDKIVPPLGFRSIQAARLMEWQGDSSSGICGSHRIDSSKDQVSIVEEPAAPVCPSHHHRRL